MATNRPGRLRLVLCGICFRADCPLSKWITEDGDLADAIDDLHMLWIECQHSEIEAAQANKLTLKEREDLIDTVTEENPTVEILNLDELLSKASNREEKEHETAIEKDFSVDDIIKKFSEQISIENQQQDKTKEHGK